MCGTLSHRRGHKSVRLNSGVRSATDPCGSNKQSTASCRFLLHQVRSPALPPCSATAATATPLLRALNLVRCIHRIASCSSSWHAPQTSKVCRAVGRDHAQGHRGRPNNSFKPTPLHGIVLSFGFRLLSLRLHLVAARLNSGVSRQLGQFHA